MPDLTRRDFLVAGSLAAAGGLLAACGVQGGAREPAGSASPLPSVAGRLSVAQWPLYIDADEESGRRPSVEEFERATGIKVTYKEVIEDNEQFFGTIREPLARGRSTGWDVMVMSDWIVGRMIRLGYLEELRHDALPNFNEHAGPLFVNPSYDPGNRFTVPWQAGITGIAYDPKLTGRGVDSFGDLFDPAFAGKVGMFSEMLDTVSLTLLHLGVEPHEATVEDVRAVRDKLTEARTDGIVRNFYGNDYVDALAKGDLAVTMAWSGDIFQLQEDNPSIRFVVPKEGGILWVDNMVVPRGAEHPADAHAWMNFFYRPEVSARLTEAIGYVSPVPATQGLVSDERIATSELVYPTPAMRARLRNYKTLTEDEETAWNELFAEAVQG